MGRDRGICPGTFAPALVPGHWDTGTRIFFCPGTKGQRDVPSWFVPGRPVPWKHYSTPNIMISSTKLNCTEIYNKISVNVEKRLLLAQ